LDRVYKTNPPAVPPNMATANHHHPPSLQVFGKLISLLHDVRQRNQSSAPCDRCFGPEAECVCGPRVEQCGRCAGSEMECVCFYGGGGNDACLCDPCVDCSARVISNRRGLRELVDSVLNAPPVSPEARPAMVELLDSLLGAVDGRRALKVGRVRTSMARKLFRKMMKRVCELLQQIHCLVPEDDSDWGEIYVLLHNLRDIFVHSRIPAAVIHDDFGRLCSAVCDALVIADPVSWLVVPACERRHSLLGLRAEVGRALGAVDLRFLGKWMERRVREVAAVMV
jgi:hypothetical protein